jgi:cytochrome c
MQDGKPVGSDAITVIALRSYITYLNRKNNTTLYVKLQGRGPRKVNGTNYPQSLPLKFAETADVYVYTRHRY